SKPDVISLLEQEKDPWVIKGEMTRGLCPAPPNAGLYHHQIYLLKS
ncbi:ZNF470 isoform 5, partial [Pongo abelii]